MKNIVFRRIRIILLFGIAVISFLSCSVGNEQIINGHFKGKADIIVNWSVQKELLFNLNIDSTNKVTGTIGNATITKGTIKKNIFGNTDYIINIDLSGYLIKDEKIKRSSIKIPFNYENGKIIGGFGTNGSKIGGKEDMIMSGTNLVLHKILNL